MNRVSKFISIAAFSLMVLSLPAIASAQYYPNDPYGRNGGYNDPYGRNNGSYGNSNSVVRNLKSKARQFVSLVDRELDRSRVDGTRREDQINEVADRFRDAVNDLDNNGRFDERELRRVHETAQRVDRAIGRGRISYNVQNMWASIRNDLRYLGSNGNYDNNNRNNRNNRWPTGTNNRTNRNVPTWWPF